MLYLIIKNTMVKNEKTIFLSPSIRPIGHSIKSTYGVSFRKVIAFIEGLLLSLIFIKAFST